MRNIYAAPMPNTRIYARARVLRCISCSRIETSLPTFLLRGVCARARGWKLVFVYTGVRAQA